MLRYRDFPIKLDGEPLGDLAVGRFAYLDHPGGSHQLSAEICCISGVTAMTSWRYQDGPYYFRASLNEKVNDIGAVTMISPVAGAIASTTTTTIARPHQPDADQRSGSETSRRYGSAKAWEDWIQTNRVSFQIASHAGPYTTRP